MASTTYTQTAGMSGDTSATDNVAELADQAAASAASAAADLVLTDADQTATAAAAVATAADVGLTNADVVTTNADAATTTQDAIDTAADVVLTNADVVSTAADRVQTGLDAAAAALSASNVSIDQGVSTTDSPTFDGLDVTGTITSDGLAVDGTDGLSINGSFALADLMETDITDKNTRLISSGGGFRIDTLNDAKSSSVKRFNLDHATGNISFFEDTGTTPKFYWDASAESLGLGTSTVDSQLHIEKLDVTAYNASATDGQLSAGVTAFLQQTGGSNRALSQIVFQPRSGFGYNRIVNSGGSQPYMAFGTDDAERLRIDSSGNVLVGKTAASTATAGVELRPDGLGVFVRAGNSLYANRLSGNGDVIRLAKDGTTVGNITVTGSATSYNTSSDYRLKENITPIQGAADIVKMMRPCTYTFKSDGSWADGFIAHEMQELHPQAVTGSKDAMKDEEYEASPAVEATLDADGVELTPAEDAVMGTRSVPDYQGVDYSKLTPILTAAFQEALIKIDDLEARLTALEV